MIDPRTASLQEVYDYVVDHLRTMPGRAFEGRVCKYRTSDGNRCAVGALIQDHEYEDLNTRLEIEDLNVGQLVEQLKWTYDGTRLCRMLVTLQNIHDRPQNWGAGFNGELLLRETAREYKLKYTPPE